MYYRLELVPTTLGLPYYKNKIYERNENAGIDLYVATDFGDQNAPYLPSPTLLDLGCAARMVRVDSNGNETDVHYWLCPRSSIYKSGLMMANSQGVIDRSYRGTLKAPVWVLSQDAYRNNFQDQSLKGSRLFQIVAPDMGWIREVRIVESLNETTRGEGGFGSTGR